MRGKSLQHFFNSIPYTPLHPTQDLIKRCLTVNPDERITCAQACTHQWIKKDNRALSSVDLGKNLAEFKRFNAKRKFKSGVHAVIASNKMKSLMSSLKEASEEV